jgi:signal transduction histidine kinase
MQHKLYKKFIAPRSLEVDYQNREVVLNWLLVGFMGLVVAAALGVLSDLIFKRELYLLSRLVSIGLVFVFSLLLYEFSRRNQKQKLAAVILVAAFFCAASFVLYQWSIFNADASVLFSLSIIIAGILLGSRYSLYMVGIIALTLSYAEYAVSHHYFQPDLSWMRQPATGADVFVFTTIYAIIALVSWLFNRQMEMSLRRAQRSEAALKRQKALLEIKVQKRTQQLEVAQLEKMQELYRFAELGRLSTALFHDVANHLTTVSLDIEGLKNTKQSDIMQRIYENVGHIDRVVQRVRQQLQGKNTIEVLNVADEVNEVIKILSFSASEVGVSIKVQDQALKGPLLLKGDVTRFRQLVHNLISNAIEAYQDTDGVLPTKEVVIRLQRDHKMLAISVTDHGVGVKPSTQDKIFNPFYSTREKGIGIGLFVVKQVVEKDFQGTISLTSNKKQGTIFTVNLPKSYYAKTNSN